MDNTQITTKKIHILFIALLGALNTAQGQTRIDPTDTDKANILRFTVPAENRFLDEHTEYIVFSLRDDTISAAHIDPMKHDKAYLKREFLSHPFGGKRFSFDFGFAADRLVFAKKYPEIPLPVAPRVSILNFRGQKDKDKLYKIVSMCFYRDSTEYTYGWNYNAGRSGIGGQPARYKGGIAKVAAGISRDVASASAKGPFDSVLVFQAVVHRLDEPAVQGPFELEGLIYGEPSAFSGIVAEHLQAKENNFFDDGTAKWVAAWSERTITTRVKVYVGLERDGSVTILLPRYLMNWTGD